MVIKLVPGVYPAGKSLFFTILAVVVVSFCVATFRINKVLFWTCVAVVGVFAFNAGASWNQVSARFAGASALAAGLGAMYLAFADLINETWGTKVLPEFAASHHKHEFTAEARRNARPKAHFHKDATAHAAI